MSTATRTTETAEQVDPEVVKAELAELIEKRNAERDKMNARRDRLDQLTAEIARAKRDQAEAMLADDYELLPDGDHAERIDQLTAERDRVAEAVKIAKARHKSLDLAARKHRGKHFELFEADLAEQAEAARESVAEVAEPYRAAYRQWQAVLRQQGQLVADRELYLARGSNRIGRKPSEVPPMLEVTLERDLPDPALLEIEPPEIVERRPTDHMGNKIIRPKR